MIWVQDEEISLSKPLVSMDTEVLALEDILTSRLLITSRNVWVSSGPFLDMKAFALSYCILPVLFSCHLLGA